MALKKMKIARCIPFIHTFLYFLYLSRNNETRSNRERDKECRRDAAKNSEAIVDSATRLDTVGKNVGLRWSLTLDWIFSLATARSRRYHFHLEM